MVRRARRLSRHIADTRAFHTRSVRVPFGRFDRAGVVGGRFGSAVGRLGARGSRARFPGVRVQGAP